jgi:hypothetical protein
MRPPSRTMTVRRKDEVAQQSVPATGIRQGGRDDIDETF